MKRISMILMAFALVLTMTQCKKNEETNQDKTVTITLDVKNNNGSKVDVNTITGTVNFETGDKVYVGSGGKYVGTLTHNGTNFVGNITNPTENQPLQFYFLGNVTPTETLNAGTTEECSVIISDQTEHLPVFSYAPSFENYVSGVTAYTGHLLNKCALVKFNVTTPSNSPICVTGMKNKVTVDFTQNTITPNQDGESVIKLPAGSGENVEKWAILLSQNALEEGEDGSIYSEDGIYTGTRPMIPTIIDNGYFPQGIYADVDNVIIYGIPTGAINGLFSVSATQQVYFSQGNLQYIGSASTPYWKFADNQWDYFGNNGQGSSAQNVDRDLFGWGTSGYNHGAIAYQPWATSTGQSHYYAYGNPICNLNDETGMADWGYNKIENGGNEVNLWRTLSQIEWTYVFFSRTTISGTCYASAIVNGVKGIILLPDNWDNSYYPLNNVNPNTIYYDSNTITYSEWKNALEIHGAVFFPASGIRVGESLSLVGTNGMFATSTVVDNNLVYPIGFGNSAVFNTSGTTYRMLGMAVRLVQDY